MGLSGEIPVFGVKLVLNSGDEWLAIDFEKIIRDVKRKMGGFGSGRSRDYGGKDTTGDALALDVRDLARSGRLSSREYSSWTWSRGERPVASIACLCWGEGVTLIYTHGQDAEAEDIRQNVPILRTPCNYGGERLWWQCPACERRVAVIYGAGKYFACRRCCGLSYASQKENSADRALRRAKKIRARLGQSNGAPAAPFPDKPKGMHLMTYYDLLMHCRADETLWMKSLSAWTDVMHARDIEHA